MNGGGRLAIEWSSRRLSVAYEGEGVEPMEASVEVARFRAEEAMKLLEEWMEALPGGWRGVRDIRVGRGPGNYSGIRQGFAWAAGAAAPGGIRVTACSSGRAQARRLRREGETLWILGDARRGMWWGCGFGEDEEAEAAWETAPPEAWRERVRGARVVSAEASRLSGLEGVESDCPRALDLLHTEAEEACRPIYLHPPVSGAAVRG